jgi:multidrug efflux pump subunit AcrA (membrane-fusion protein)
LDGSKATDEANQAQVTAAKAAVYSAKAQIASAVANVSVSEGCVRDSELRLSYCTVIAPVSGRIAQRSVESGNRLTVGQATMLPPSKRPLGLALFGITAILGPAVGPYVGGVLGAGLYGSVFLLPQYLEQVQEYSARQTGMVLIGLLSC